MSPGSAQPPRLSSNLPTPPSSFIGRETEQAEVSSLVTHRPLVTITGPGGSGKTRLAIAVAAGLVAEGHVGASFVELAPIADQAQVPAALAAAMGVREQASRPLAEVLADALSGQDLLVVIDNCEHVIDAAAELAVMLNRKCPRLRLLATSREPLGVDGEHVYRLGPLSLPSAEARSVKDLEGSDAVRLFAERARAHDSTFCLEDSTAGLVASVCRRLDGIPLAIELAAARVASMSLAHLEERLDQRFRLLTGGPRTALPRQRTLQATIDWSFELLSPPEQAVLSRLIGLFRELRAGGGRSGLLDGSGGSSRRRRLARFAGQQEPGNSRALLGLAPLLATGNHPAVRHRAAVGIRRRS